MKNKLYLVFDFDGTLADSFSLIMKCFLTVFHNHGLQITKEGVDKYFGPSEEGILINVFGEEEGKKIFFDKYLPFYKKYHQEYLPSIDKSIISILDYLKSKDIPIILLTGRSSESCDISLKFLKLDQYFMKIYTGSIHGINKPDSFKKLMKDLNVKAENLLYIGDSLKDVESCRSVGVKIISVAYYNLNKYDDLNRLNPSMVVKSPDELFSKIKEELELNK